MALLDCRELGPVPYETAWEMQKRLVDAFLAERQAEEEGSSSISPSSRRPVGALILLQHEPVYTLGAGATTDNLRFDPGKAFLEGEGGEAERERRNESEEAASSSSSSSLLPPPPAPLHRVERGGEVTWHGPGQLVLYPILDLRAGEASEGEGRKNEAKEEEKGKRTKPFLTDLHWYLRALEEVVVSALARLPSHPLLLLREAEAGEEAERSGGAPLLVGEREPGLTGVWVGGAKAAALGVRAARWATYHGLALNVNPDMSYFDHIVPCGIVGREVASVVTAWERAARARRGGEGGGCDGEERGRERERERGRAEEEDPFRLPASWRERPGEGPLVAAAGDALLAAFCDVLGVRLESVGETPRELLLPGSKDERVGGGKGREKTTMLSFSERVVRGRK